MYTTRKLNGSILASYYDETTNTFEIKFSVPAEKIIGKDIMQKTQVIKQEFLNILNKIAE